jgi:hypothetical protein
MTTKRVLVCGGREYTNDKLIYQTLDNYLISCLNAGEDLILCCGGARGADALAKQWAVDNGIMHKIYNANWKKWGRRAGPERNQLMIDDFKPDLVIAFPGGGGTADTISRANKAGIQVVKVGAQNEYIG